MKIQRIVFPAPHEILVETIEQDLSPRPGEIVVQNLFSLVSAGTEMHKFHGDQKDPPVQFPFVPGNRAVGRVLSVGQGVSDVKEGDLVFTHAPHASHVRYGGFRAPVPSGVELAHAPVLGLAMVAMTPVRMARPELGDWAVVFGAGVVGNLTAQLFALAGAQVVLVDVAQHRLDLARRCGIQHVVCGSGADAVQKILANTGDAGAEFVVEAAGMSELFQTACDVCRKGGEVIYVGSPRRPFMTDLTAALNRAFIWREHSGITLRGAHEWRYPPHDDGFHKHTMARNARILYELMKQKKLLVEPMISHVFPADQATRVYREVLADTENCLGVVFDWTRPMDGEAS